MNDQILEFSRNDVEVEVSKSVVKCLQGLQIEMDNSTIQLLVEDIVDKYKWDSIEDIRECIKKGRRGYYGKVYGKLNMIIISEWMAKHLEKKAIAREKRHMERATDLHKHNWISKDDYVKSVTKSLESKEIRNEKYIDSEFNKFKAEYLKNAKPEGTIKEKKQ
jgi:hypothetical protein